MDRIELSAIRSYGYTGFLAEEKTLGQWFEVDLSIQVDLAQAGQSDDLSHTLDYRAVIAQTQDIVKTAQFDLVERLAQAIADAVLVHDRVTEVRVRLHKPAAPIPDFGGRITIDITRRKQR
ncbi:MAG: dihydroneopterin aldolase [Synechococcales bacterium]|nr:dihydroneopterin aldolase [Synechococcales bacterium]